jgi:hypothetical protein
VSERDIRNNVAFKFVETGINLAVVQLLGAFANRFKQKWFRINLWINTENIQHNPRGGTVVPTTNDITVADDEHEFAFVIVVESGQRIDRTPQRVFTLGVAGYLTYDEFVK